MAQDMTYPRTTGYLKAELTGIAIELEVSADVYAGQPEKLAERMMEIAARVKNAQTTAEEMINAGPDYTTD